MPAENAGRAFALVVVDELVRHGVEHAVVAPGSRSTPLALAFAEDQRIRLHVRIDERSAAFFALGIARETGRPVPILCTSGTATAHFHAAVLEADQSRVPLLVLTADRPPELRGVGANQTVDQTQMYGAAVRWFCDAGVPEARADAVAYWRSLISRACATALGKSVVAAGPVHLNLPLREPLVPLDDGVGFPFSLDGRADGLPWTSSERAPSAAPEKLLALINGATTGVVVAGDGLSSPEVNDLLAFAERRRWPVIAEPHSNARRGPNALRSTDALLSGPFAARHRPDLVVVAGRVGLSRALLGWLAATPHVGVDRDGAWNDPTRTAVGVFRADTTALAGASASAADESWLATWAAASTAASDAIDRLLDGTPGLTEPRVARDVAAALAPGAALVVASSMPIRDLDATMRPRDGLRIVANRGVSGIDGFVSTALGVAATHTGGPTVALAGDLSILHDVNGFLADDRPDITIVVINNDGGGIFSLLPQSALDDGQAFETLFGTPHGIDFARLADVYGVQHNDAKDADQLTVALAQPAAGVRLVEVRTERRDNAALHRHLREAAATAVAETLN
jgi:2-succinyl-5-enolpyruvyl-6-hydroxy-3-cyclohexene-1-carboxylate synthase